jgi:hypothetical protein
LLLVPLELGALSLKPAPDELVWITVGMFIPLLRAELVGVGSDKTRVNFS